MQFRLSALAALGAAVAADATPLENSRDSSWDEAMEEGNDLELGMLSGYRHYDDSRELRATDCESMCGTNRQLISSDRDFASLVYDCLVENDGGFPKVPATCPYQSAPYACWDTSEVTDMSGTFQDVAFDTLIPTLRCWDTSKVTDMGRMFFRSGFNEPLQHFDTSNVENMVQMFQGSSFDQPVDTWRTSKVTDMSNMFASTSFNNPIQVWDTTNLVRAGKMFDKNPAFNQPLDSWNTDRVTDMENMFEEAISFNQPLGSWNTAKVTEMFGMFKGAVLFNQEIDSWGTNQVTNMMNMFNGATAFNQCLSSWAIKTPDNAIMVDMLDGSACPVKFPDPDPTVGPWCQDERDNCFEPSPVEPSPAPVQNVVIPVPEPTPIVIQPVDPPVTPIKIPRDDPCANIEEEFVWKRKRGKMKLTSCAKLAVGKKRKKLKVCNKNIGKESCPELCNPDCLPEFTCTNASGDFEYKKKKNKMKTTSCAKLAASKAKKIVKVCEKDIAKKECPVVCDDRCKGPLNCTNSNNQFFWKKTKPMSCEKLEKVTQRKRKKVCKRGISKRECPGICNLECGKVENPKCINTEQEFGYGSGKTTTCANLAKKGNNDQRQICKDLSATIKCPGLCDRRCLCKNFDNKFAVNDGFTRCRKVGKSKQPSCSDPLQSSDPNGALISDMCPLKCKKCW